MKNKFRLWILIVLIFTTMSPVYGQGNSSGGGKSNAFDFVESSPGNLARNVELNSLVKLLFNKNVVHFTVKDNNAKCFSIKNEKGEEIPIEIIFADDQIEPDKKREIILRARDPFAENTTYTIDISPELRAKNGSSLDKNVSISFTTLGSKPKEDDSISKDRPDEKNIKSPENIGPDKKQENRKEEREVVAEEKGTDSSNQSKDKMDLHKENMEGEKENSSSGDAEKPVLSQTKEDSSLEADLEVEKDLDNGNNSVDGGGKESTSGSKKYVVIIAVGAAIGLIFAFRKKQ